MKIVERHGLFEKVVEYEYKPTREELLYYYSGTHGGFNRDNPYNRSRYARATITRYIPVKPLSPITKKKESS